MNFWNASRKHFLLVTQPQLRIGWKCSLVPFRTPLPWPHKTILISQSAQCAYTVKHQVTQDLPRPQSHPLHSDSIPTALTHLNEKTTADFSRLQLRYCRRPLCWSYVVCFTFVQGATPPPASKTNHAHVTLLLSRDPLSLAIMSTYFKQFTSIIGPVFWLQDCIEEIIHWKTSPATIFGWQHIRSSVHYMHFRLNSLKVSFPTFFFWCLIWCHPCNVSVSLKCGWRPHVLRVWAVYSGASTHDRRFRPIAS